eukprot:g19662.t1
MPGPERSEGRPARGQKSFPPQTERGRPLAKLPPTTARTRNFERKREEQETASDSFEEKNHLTCTEDACLKWLRFVVESGIISRTRFDEWAAYAQNPLAGMVNKNVFSCEDEEEVAEVMVAEREALRCRLITIVKTEKINFTATDVRMAVEFLTKSKTRRALAYIDQNSKTSAARAAASNSNGAATEKESTPANTKAEIERQDWDAICGSGDQLPPALEKSTREDMFADRLPPGDENEKCSSSGDAIQPAAGAVDETAVKIEDAPTSTLKQEAEVGDPGDAAGRALGQ